MSVADIKAAVRERDGHRCTACGMTAEEHRARYGRTLDVHRIAPGSRYTVEGSVTLCRACHGLQPRRRRGGGQPDLGHGDPSVTFRISGRLHARLDAAADGLSLDISSLLRMLIRQNLPTYEKQAEDVRRRESKEDCP